MKQSFYGSIYAFDYDVGTTTPYTPFYLEEWERVGRPSPVLEPMCGTGLNLAPF
jgi:hypothetical protein